MHVKLPHTSVKKGVSVLGNAQASGPHVAEGCKLGEETRASVFLQRLVIGGLGQEFCEAKRGSKI